LDIQIPSVEHEGFESDGGVAVDVFFLNIGNQLSKLELHKITP
jgi:hypothetical protein